MSGDRGTMADQLEQTLPELPDGEYGIVEIMGHRILVGLVEEVQRFGQAMMSVRPILRGQLLDPIYLNASSIFMHTPVNREQALKHAPKHDYQLPEPVRCALPAGMLAARPAGDDGPGPEFAAPIFEEDGR